MTLTDMQDALDSVTTAATDQFAEGNPGRLDQLLSSAQTVLMAIDALFTEVPYRF